MGPFGIDDAKTFLGRRAELMRRLRLHPRDALGRKLAAELRALVNEELRREVAQRSNARRPEKDAGRELGWWQR